MKRTKAQVNDNRRYSRQVNKAFKGKTIARVDTSSCNMWKFHFTDGSIIEVETEAIGLGLYGFALVPQTELLV
jgi:hypothetical protein